MTQRIKQKTQRQRGGIGQQKSDNRALKSKKPPNFGRKQPQIQFFSLIQTPHNLRSGETLR